MGQSMMERFEVSGFEPVAVDGEFIHPMWVGIGEGDHIRLTWLSSNSPRVQGVSLRLRIPDVQGRDGEGGVLRIERREAPTMVLWMDTSPKVVEAECVSVRSGAELQVSNRWRLPDGRDDEWLGNYGIRIEPTDGDGIVLHCSDGYGDTPTFEDLVVRVDVRR
jgi:hypothetical protein